MEQARRRAAAKRGGHSERKALDAAEMAAPAPDQQILAVHEVLNDFAGTDPQVATLIKLRYFSGMTMTEVAEALGMSVRSAHDLWAYARSWLHRYMRTK